MTVSINGTSGIVFNDASTQNTAATGFGFKNRIINGAMTIDQRNAGTAVTAADSFVVDRFSINPNGQQLAFSGQQISDAPAGFVNSIRVTVTTPETTFATTDWFDVRQNIEGLNIADLAWGTADASPVTLSFRVKSSLTGTFGGSFMNSAKNRAYPFSYVISAANTWTTVSITIAGDTTGTWLTTNGVGILVTFSLGAGSTYQGTAGAWTASRRQGVTGQVQLGETNGATWQVTGVQLEKGSTATSFDYRPYGTELALCQRYFVRDLQAGTNATFLCGVISSSIEADRCGMRFPVTMRSAPTATVGGTANPRIYDGAAAPAITGISLNASSTFGACLGFIASGGLTTGRAAIIIDNNASFISYSSEL